MEEIWKDIPGYEGLYQVSDLGRVMAVKTGLYRMFGDNGAGYMFVPLSNNKKIKNHYVHRLVATLFIPNPENKPTVNHKNGIKRDNRAVNLEWATQSENSQHGFDTGLIKQNSGKFNPCSKPVLQYSLSGEFIKQYDCISDAGNKNNIYAQNISSACSGRYKQAGGFIWKYME